MHTVAKISDEDENNVLNVIRQGKVSYVVNTMSIKRSVAQDGFLIRRVSAENNIPCFTSLDTANAIASIIEARSFATISMNDLEG